jgi:hypothetical protein
MKFEQGIHIYLNRSQSRHREEPILHCSVWIDTYTSIYSRIHIRTYMKARAVTVSQCMHMHLPPSKARTSSRASLFAASTVGAVSGGPRIWRRLGPKFSSKSIKLGLKDQLSYQFIELCYMSTRKNNMSKSYSSLSCFQKKQERISCT